MKRFLLLTTIFIHIPNFLYAAEFSKLPAKEEPENVQPIAQGNFVLQYFQQPGPLVSFGQNILNQGQFALSAFVSEYFGPKNNETDLVFSVFYGITNNFSLTLTVPFISMARYGDDHSRGAGDLFFQFEYAFLKHYTKTTEDVATFVANMSVPTGSANTNPPTGFGAPSFFLGATYAHTGVYWYSFISPGVLLPAGHMGTQFGNEFWYQFGVGRYIPSPKGWIFNWLVEFDGTYAWKDTDNYSKDPDSGGNTIYITPSVAFANDNLSIQCGAGPVIQNLNGDQFKQYLSGILSFTYTF